MSIDVILIMMSCVLANHLGLVEAVERVIRHRIPVVNCPKCFTFWSVFAYSILSSCDVIISVFMSFLMALSALWFDVFIGFIDKLYYKAYEWTYDDKEPTDAEVPETNNSHYVAETNTMPEMWWVEE